MAHKSAFVRDAHAMLLELQPFGPGWDTLVGGVRGIVGVVCVCVACRTIYPRTHVQRHNNVRVSVRCSLGYVRIVRRHCGRPCVCVCRCFPGYLMQSNQGVDFAFIRLRPHLPTVRGIYYAVRLFAHMCTTHSRRAVLSCVCVCVRNIREMFRI